jgi:N-acetylglutamate synthase-like GNAT family acetyltransferase
MIRIEPFTETKKEDVVGLILPIQQEEFNIKIAIGDQPDLLDIPAFYKKGNGNFWVALSDGEVVGTIGLLDIGDGNGALRKMFVKAAFRGGSLGVAHQLLDTLMDWSRKHKMKAIYLGTTSQFLAAHRFYEKNGFAQIDKPDLPLAFPVMAVDSRFYKFSLAMEN